MTAPKSRYLYDEQFDGWKDDERVWVRRYLRSYSSDLDRIIPHIMALAEGLTDPDLSAEPWYDDAQIVVRGIRFATDDEKADRDRQQRTAWLAAKAQYEAGAAKFATDSNPSRTSNG